ncbi:transposase IS66, partial [mine drainage metagenome]
GRSAEEILKRRQERSAPIFAAFHKWVEDLLPATPPQSALGRALSYTHNQWNKLVLHLEHGDVPAHNNY